jgi:hypothetical protein
MHTTNGAEQLRRERIHTRWQRPIRHLLIFGSKYFLKYPENNPQEE